jgi:predicted PurR-regulated permease PerM
MTPRRFSFVLLAATLVLTGWQHMSTLLLTVLFSLFVIRKLHFTKSRWPAVGLFVVVLFLLGYGAVRFLQAAVVTLPKIAEQAVPSVITFAETHGINLPFDDYESLKGAVIAAVKEQTQYVSSAATLARGASMQVLLFIAGLVVAASIFLSGRIDLDHDRHALQRNLYAAVSDEVAARFRVFYESFETVLGAQVIISAVNATLTVIFMLVVGLPHVAVIFGIAFLCGLLPIVGNLISNTIIVCVGFLISPATALAALVFLVAVHKLEYFLNSKIIGLRIRNPLWLTLVGIIVGEHLMGIPGIALAPVVLHYIKVEATTVPATAAPAAAEPSESASRGEAARGGGAPRALEK